MAKPPRRPRTQTRKTDAVSEKTRRSVVAKPVDPRQAGLFDAPLPAWIKPCLPTLVDKDGNAAASDDQGRTSFPELQADLDRLGSERAIL